MKSNIKILAILLALFFSFLIFTKQASAQQNYAGSDLVPYSKGGHWILPDLCMNDVTYFQNFVIVPKRKGCNFVCNLMITSGTL